MIFTNNLNLPPMLERALKTDNYSKNTKYSVTQLLKSDRSIILEQRHPDYHTDVSENLWRFLGHAVHHFLESGEGSNDLTEERIAYTTACGADVSGQLDHYDGKTLTLTDFKITTKYKVLREDYDDYQKQLSILAWLLKRAGFEVKKIQNILILRDWNRQDERKIPNAIAVVEHELLTTISGLSVKEWVDRRVELIERAQKLPDDDLPECSENYRWATDDEYKVYWNESTAENPRSKKNFDNRDDAEAYARELEAKDNGKKTYRVELVSGEKFKRCGYCNASEFCSQYLAGTMEMPSDEKKTA